VDLVIDYINNFSKDYIITINNVNYTSTLSLVTLSLVYLRKKYTLLKFVKYMHSNNLI